MVKQFAATFLPSPLIYITGLGIAIGEAGIGTLLIFGLLLRPTLVVGTLLMLLLIFGSTLIQEYQALSTQMVAVAFSLDCSQQFATIGFPWTEYDSVNSRVRSLRRKSVRLWSPQLLKTGYRHCPDRELDDGFRFRLNPAERPAIYTAFELSLHESQFERVQVRWASLIKTATVPASGSSCG
jgi:hypothetical protein